MLERAGHQPAPQEELDKPADLDTSDDDDVDEEDKSTPVSKASSTVSLDKSDADDNGDDPDGLGTTVALSSSTSVANDNSQPIVEGESYDDDDDDDEEDYGYRIYGMTFKPIDQNVLTQLASLQKGYHDAVDQAQKNKKIIDKKYQETRYELNVAMHQELDKLQGKNQNPTVGQQDLESNPDVNELSQTAKELHNTKRVAWNLKNTIVSMGFFGLDLATDESLMDWPSQLRNATYHALNDLGSDSVTRSAPFCKV